MFQANLLAQTKDSTAIVEISGVWGMDAAVQMQQSSSLNRNSQNPLKEEHREGQLESMRSRVYIFHEGGIFESSWVSLGGSRIVHGKWTIRKDGLLEIALEDNSAYAYSIGRSKSGLQLIPESPDLQSINLQRIEP